MKAPTADYSPLSQALSSKSSAIQASYSSKDASNWKSSYDIQQKSFGLQQDSLDLQKESIDLSRQQTNVSGALNVFNGVLDLADTIIQAKQDDITQDLTLSSTEMANEWQTQLQSNADYVEEKEDPVTGGVTIALSEKGQKAYNALAEKYFPSGTKYGWGMDEKANLLKENLRVSCLSYAQSQGLDNINTSFDTKFQYNWDYAMELDLTSGDTEEVVVSDGAGGTKTLKIGRQAKALIDGTNKSEDWKRTWYEYSAKELITEREKHITTDITTGYTDGTYINDAEARAVLDSTIEAHLETITDPTERKTAEDSFKEAKSTAIQTYYTNQINSIKAEDKDVYTKLGYLYATVSKDAKDREGKSFTHKSLFYNEDGTANKYVSESTLSLIRSSISTEMSTIETSAGTQQTNTVNNALTSLNAQLKSGDISPEGWVTRFRSTMKTVYGDSWENNTEAKNIYSKNVLSLLPSELSSDPTFKAAWNSSVSLMFNMDSSKLDASQQLYAETAKTGMMNELMELTVQDPTIALDPVKYATTLQDIASRYNATWLDLMDDSFQADYFQTLGGTEAEKVWGDEMDKIIGSYSDEIMENLSSNGTWDRTDDNLPEGINTVVSEFTVGLAENGAKADYIKDPRAGQIQFTTDENGNLEVSRVIWPCKEIDGIENANVIYNAQTGEWEFTGIPSTSTTSTPSKSEDNTSRASDSTVDLTPSSINFDIVSGKVTPSVTIEPTKTEEKKADSTAADDSRVIDSEAFREAQTYSEEHAKVGVDEFYQHLKSYETQEEFEDAVEGFLYEAENSDFLRNKVDDPEALINGYADDIREKKGWTKEEETEEEQSTIQSDSTVKGNGTPVAESKKDETKTEALSTEDWVKKNPSPSGEEIIRRLDTADDGREEALKLKKLIESGDLTINPLIEKLIEEYLREHPEKKTKTPAVESNEQLSKKKQDLKKGNTEVDR